ncbi:hypothetical protein K492DRAFT_65232 [Lichtheimia hyalospora FSU 10163]|nr:hypothetical protein K492DRAFT_65232 [Lichtheimia hyalospora FSU 10163]
MKGNALWILFGHKDVTEYTWDFISRVIGSGVERVSFTTSNLTWFHFLSLLLHTLSSGQMASEVTQKIMQRYNCDELSDFRRKIDTLINVQGSNGALNSIDGYEGSEKDNQKCPT